MATDVEEVLGTFYTTREVATALRVSQRTVEEWIRTGKLTAIRFGSLLRIRKEDLLAFGVVVRKDAPAGLDQRGVVGG